MISAVEKIREFMKEQGVNFLLVNSTNKYLEEYTPLEENSRYFLTDFSGSTGDVLVTFEDIYLFVDGRYHIQADLEVNHDIVSVVKLQTGQTFLDELIKKIPQDGTLGIFAKKNSQTRVEYLEKNGIKTPKTKIKNLYPGYVFIEMIMTDESWYMVRNTPGVTGIAGSSGGGQKPTPVSAKEMETVLKRMGMVDDSMYESYKVGDRVKIIHGTFANIEGEISSIDKENGSVRVNIIFFGRQTPVDVEFSEIIHCD